MPSVGPLELAIVLIIALVIFGPKKLPELGSSVGRGIREFKHSISADDGADERSKDLRGLPAARSAEATPVDNDESDRARAQA